MNLDGRIVVLADGTRWRAHAPGWRLWRWLGYLRRRLVVALIPGCLLPRVAWVPGRRVELTTGMPPRRAHVFAERVGKGAGKIAAMRKKAK